MTTIPGFVDYSIPAETLTAVGNVVSLLLPTGWTNEKGAVGVLVVEALTGTAFIRRVGATHTAAPLDPIVSASATASVVGRMGPVRRADVTLHELYTSGATDQVLVQWVPITDWGE